MHISLIITFLLVIIILCFGYILYLKIFKKYTRERFAFVGLTAIFGLITMFMSQVYSSQGVLSAVINTSNFYLNTNLKTYETDYRDHFIVFVLITILISFIHKIHQNWSGPISTITAEKRRFREDNNIIEEFVIQLNDFFRSKENKKIIFHKPDFSENKYSVFSSNEFEKAPWFEDVYELFVFRSSQYDIDLHKDFYVEENCFIAKFGHNKESIAILCSFDTPNENELNRFIKFSHSINTKYVKLIIAIKNGENASFTKIINGKSIEFRYESELLNSLVDFKYYSQYIKEQFSVKPITENSKITLKDFYVDLRAKNENDGLIENIEEYAINWSKSSVDNRHLAILGEYGCGKSVFSLKFALELLKTTNRIPILIELRGKSPRNLGALEILSTWASSFRIEPMALWKLHKEGKLVIIFEGFDEMDMVGDKEVRFSHFQRLWEFAIPKSKIIITGRPNFFLDDKELKINLGIDKPFETSHFCEAIYLEKLNRDQIKIALRNVESETKRQVVALLNQNGSGSNFYDLVSRPAILYLVSVIWKERKLSNLKEQINSAIIIGEFIQYSYSRQTDKKASFPLTEHEREYFMLGVAAGMHKLTELSNQISKNDLENIILKLYRDFPNDVLPVKNATQQHKNSLKERMKDNNNAEEMILTDVRSCGILVNDLARKDYFKFAHKSFFEYSVSLFFVESVMRENSINFIIVKSISNSLDIVLSNFVHSVETMTFTAEILISKLSLTSDKKENEKNIVSSLFEILYPFRILCKFPRIVGYFEVFSANKMFTLNFMFLILISTYFSNFYKIFPPEYYNVINKISKTLFFITPMFIILLTTFYRTTIKDKALKRIQIWLRCCQQLNINDEIILKVISIDFLKLIKEGYKDNFETLLRNYIVIFRKIHNLQKRK